MVHTDTASTAPIDPNAVKVTALNHVPFVKAGSDEPIATMIHVDAPKLANLEARKKPLHVSAVIDVSGSMQGEKLHLAKESLRVMVEELTDKDEFGIIAFESSVFEAFPKTKMDQVGKERARSAIFALKDMGSTNLSGGLFAGICQVRGLPTGAVPVPGGSGMRPASGGFMAKAASLFSSNSSLKSSCLTATMPPPPPTAPTTRPATMTVSHTRADGNGKYTYNVETTQCPGVSSVSVGSSLLPHKSGFDVMWDPVDTLVPFVDVRVQFANPARGSEVFCYKFGDAAKGSKNFEVITDAVTAAVPTAAAANAEAAHIVLLFTDGQANAGIIEPPQLIGCLKSALTTHPTDVVVHTFGYGQDHNAALLQGIAESSQGTYYYIKDTESMKSSFADCLGGILSIVCTGIVVEVETTAGFSIHEIKTAFPKVTKPNGIVEISMKDLYSEEKRDIVVLLKPTAPMAVIADVPMVKFTVRCDNSISGKKESVTANATLTVANEAYTGTPNEEVEKQLVRFRITDAIADARRAADSGDLVSAKAKMESAKAHVRFSPAANTTYVAHMMDEMAEVEDCMDSTHHWGYHGAKVASKMYAQHQQQRCNTSTGSSGLYANSMQDAMRFKHTK